MRAAAEFNRPGRLVALAGPHGHDAHLIAVFLAEQRHRALGDGGVRRHETGRDLGVFPDAGVHLGLNPGQFVGCDGAGLADIETQPVRGIQAAFLHDMLAEFPAHRLMQQMGGGVMGANGAAAMMVHNGHHRRANTSSTRLDPAKMDEQIA